jgi:putative peptidoglycan lipid II flippase
VAAMNVANTLICYLGVLLGVGLIDITRKGFVVIQNTFIPMMIMSASFLFYVLIALPLCKLFSFLGLAISLSITFLVGVIADLFILNKLLKGIYVRKILITIFKVSISSLIMGFTVWGLNRNLDFFINIDSRFFIFLKIIVNASIGIFLYTVICFILKLEELGIIYNLTFVKLFKENSPENLFKV